MRNALCTLIILSAGMLHAAPVSLTLTPTGTLSGHPGDTVGWGFTLVNGLTDWISITNVVLSPETNPALGTFTDFMGPQGGPLPSFAVAPGATWSESFNNGLSQGVGSYLIAANPILPNNDSGSVLVNFDTFNADPTTPSARQTGTGSASAIFSIDVTAATVTAPEPGSALLTLAVSAWMLRKKITR